MQQDGYCFRGPGWDLSVSIQARWACPASMVGRAGSYPGGRYCWFHVGVAITVSRHPREEEEPVGSVTVSRLGRHGDGGDCASGLAPCPLPGCAASGTPCPPQGLASGAASASCHGEAGHLLPSPPLQELGWHWLQDTHLHLSLLWVSLLWVPSQGSQVGPQA